MAIWKKTVTRLGKERYFKDSKNVKQIDDVPFIIRDLEPGQTMELDDMPVTHTTVPDSPPLDQMPSHVSIISGEPATRRRWLNGTEYWLTQDEYNMYNLGKLAQAIREKEEETEE